MLQSALECILLQKSQYFRVLQSALECFNVLQSTPECSMCSRMIENNLGGACLTGKVTKAKQNWQEKLFLPEKESWKGCSEEDHFFVEVAEAAASAASWGFKQLTHGKHSFGSCHYTEKFSLIICHGALLSHSMFETNWESSWELLRLRARGLSAHWDQTYYCSHIF